MKVIGDLDGLMGQKPEWHGLKLKYKVKKWRQGNRQLFKDLWQKRRKRGNGTREDMRTLSKNKFKKKIFFQVWYNLFYYPIFDFNFFDSRCSWILFYMFISWLYLFCELPYIFFLFCCLNLFHFFISKLSFYI